MEILKNIYPERVMHYFEEICKIPHGSGNTKAISDFCVDFAKEHNLQYYQDELNNVIIFKDASSDKLGCDPVIIQGHLDMVCAKEADCKKNFKTEGLDIYVEDGYIKAKGTTLGGDDGIAIAYALAILESDSISHPPIEALFTVDEETGLFGASGIDLSMCKGKKLLNIDSEEEGILTAGCAGGARVEICFPVEWDEARGMIYSIEINGLLGGHSGVEINKGRANANKLLFTVLNEMMKDVDFRLISLSGGDKDNAIASSAKAQFVVVDEYAPELDEFIEKLKIEYPVEKGMNITCKYLRKATTECFDERCTLMLIGMFNEFPCGVQKMSKDIAGLVQTSLNFGTLNIAGKGVVAIYSVRSSVAKEKEELVEYLSSNSKLFGCYVYVSGEYPSWEYKKISPLRDTMCKVYKEKFNKDIKVDVIHAGLECGILSEKIKDLDAVSFGPDILDIHTPNERLSIESVGRTWDYLLAVLKEL